MRAWLELEGVKEMIAKMERGQREIPAELAVGLEAGMMELRKVTASYPPQVPTSSQKWKYVRGVGRYYIPTGKQYFTSERYGATQTVKVDRQPREVVGYLNFKASYSVDLRGDMDGNGQKKLHADHGWEKLTTIVDHQLPITVRRLEGVVQDWIRRNDL